MTRYFSPELFRFLRDLEANNERTWFHENKARYERVVREPALAFVNDIAPKLAKISPHLVADSRPVGGSMFRIHRDTRFSKDKTPYKTYVGIQFRHEAAKDVHAPGLYLHLEARACMAALGVWRPPTADAYRIREAIAADPAGWRKAAYGKRFRDVFRLEGDALKRPPKGFDPDHPAIEDLKRKDFIASTALTQRQVTSDGVMDEFLSLMRRGTPFMRFLAGALGQPY